MSRQALTTQAGIGQFTAVFNDRMVAMREARRPAAFHGLPPRRLRGRFVAIPMIHRAFAAGVNYIDTAVGYCKPCPNKVDIPAVFGLYNLARVWGVADLARERYAKLARKGVAAEVCVQCGECEPKCPQHLPIREQLAQSHEGLRD